MITQVSHLFTVIYVVDARIMCDHVALVPMHRDYLYRQTIVPVCRQAGRVRMNYPDIVMSGRQFLLVLSCPPTGGSYAKKSTENNGNKKFIIFMTIFNDFIYEHLLKYKTLTMCET
ncbi:MAG: hypothetical protein IIB44_07190 [Candidatus Marinimicrobia bacterium]|nr:hypothetical protein [Candidatus Neomarinimicrobiota bacterium]